MQRLRSQFLRVASSTRCHQHSRKYSIAIARAIPDSFSEALAQYADPTARPVSITIARQQHQAYLQQLRERIPTIELPALENNPDCGFVEDTVVAIGNSAILTTPGHESRRSEVSTMGEMLGYLGMQVTNMNDINPHAKCDGGDVLFTGRHIFVGLSKRTNALGAKILESHSYPVQVVESPTVGEEFLHLKSIVTHLDSRTLIAPQGEMGDAILESMEAGRLGYQAIRLPDINACNLVVVNDAVIAQGGSTCEKSKELLSRAASSRNLKLSYVDTSELAKKDGALTCCSVLLDL